jgi:hypothetical protein
VSVSPKSQLSEIDIYDRFITPALVQAGWTREQHILRFGRVVVRGQVSHRDKASMLRAGYVLFHKPNVPLAVVEAKDAKHSVGAGIRVLYFLHECMACIKLFPNAPSGMNEMKRLAITTCGLYNLSVGKIRSFFVPVPSIAEQFRILTRVTALRRMCADLRQRLAELQSMPAGLAEAMVANNLRTPLPKKDMCHAA